jgi:hypothetical protein
VTASVHEWRQIGSVRHDPVEIGVRQACLDGNFDSKIDLAITFLDRREADPRVARDGNRAPRLVSESRYFRSSICRWLVSQEILRRLLVHQRAAGNQNEQPAGQEQRPADGLIDECWPRFSARR